MSVDQITKSRIKKHFITDIVKTIDQDIHNEDHESIYNLVELMLGFEKNWLILSDYLTPEINKNLQGRNNGNVKSNI